MRNLKFYFSEAFDSLAKNKLMACASIITVASCIFIFSISFCMAQNINFFLKQLDKSIGLSVIISDNLEDEKIKSLEKKLLDIKYIDEIKFIPADKALKDFMSTFDDSADFLNGLEKDNPLPRSFDIKLKDNKNYSAAIKILENMKSEGIIKVKHAQEETDILLSLSKIIRLISAIIIFVLGLISIIIIINTIELAVNARKDEISIMKFIGATDWFIRWPFLIEGIIIGFIGSAVPVFICWPCYNESIKIINNKFGFIKNLFAFETGINIFSKLIPIGLGLGVFIGITGSFFSVKKYLDV